MLKDARYSNGNDFANFAGRVDEELRKGGRYEDGTPKGHAAASGFLDKENRKSLSQSDTEEFNKVMARERERAANMQNQDASRLHKAGASVAAQYYQARGHLPQYDGAADSLSSGVGSSHDHSSNQPKSATSKTESLVSLKVDSTVPAKHVAPSSTQATLRKSALDSLHFARVNEFFDTIREEERQEIAKYKARYPF